MESLFNLIRDFPDSNEELGDFIREAGIIAGNHKHKIYFRDLRDSLNTQLKNRLLIPGAHTRDILKMYVRTYKTLLGIVNSAYSGNSASFAAAMTVLESASELIIAYLLKRKDAVKCVVSAVLGDDDCLFDEMNEPSEALDFIETAQDDDYAPVTPADLTWQPPPLRNDRQNAHSLISSKNLVSLLVGVFGGRDRFLSQFTAMLAERLLALGNYDCDRETQSLELMKIKFGDDDLIESQVMIKDVMNSRRTNTAVMNLASHKLSGLSALILSRHYWPSGSSPSLTNNKAGLLPAAVEELLNQYAELFKKMKPNQRLEWRRSEGVLLISVEMKGESRDFRVSPIHVAVLNPFQSCESHSVESISRKVDVPAETVKRLLSFWVVQGVLREVDVNTYQSTDSI